MDVFEFVFFFSSEKVCFGWMLWTPFSPLWFTLFFVTLQKTLQFVCETKKRTYGSLFFFSSEKVCFGQMLWLPFFYHNDLHCFFFCKKHCSLFVKKKKSFSPLWFTLFFVTLPKTLQFVCETKKRTYGSLFFTTMIYIVFCSVKNTAVCLWKKKIFFFSHLKKFVLDRCFGCLFFTTMIYIFICSVKKMLQFVCEKKKIFFFSHLEKFVLGGCFGPHSCFWNQNYWKTLGLKKTQVDISET